MRYRPVEPVTFWLGLVLVAVGALGGGAQLIALSAGLQELLAVVLGAGGVSLLLASYAFGAGMPGVAKVSETRLPRFQPHRPKP